MNNNIQTRNYFAIQAWNMSGSGKHKDKKKEKKRRKCRGRVSPDSY
jgi:hypothetical protein